MNVIKKVLVALALFGAMVFAARADYVNEWKDGQGITWHLATPDMPYLPVPGIYLGPEQINTSAKYRITGATIPKRSLTALDGVVKIPRTAVWYSYGDDSTPQSQPNPDITVYPQSVASSTFRGISDLREVICAPMVQMKCPCFLDCPDLVSIKTSLDDLPNNPIADCAHATRDGVLFDGLVTEIFKYPEGKEGNCYAVPETVVALRQYCFANTKLRQIDFPGDVIKVVPKDFEETVFKGSDSLTRLTYPYGAKDWPDEFCGIKTAARLTAPTVRVENRVDGVYLSWDAVEHATAYVLYYSDESPDPAAMQIYKLDENLHRSRRLSWDGVRTWDERCFLDTQVVPGQTRYYCVMARGFEPYAESPMSKVAEGCRKDCCLQLEIDSWDYVRGCSYVDPSQSPDGGALVDGVLTIPDGVSGIGGNLLFEGDVAIRKVVLPSSLSAILEGTFEACPNLTQVEGGENLSYIGDQAFDLTPLIRQDAEEFRLVRIGNCIIGWNGANALWREYENSYKPYWRYELVIPEGVTGVANLNWSLPLTELKLPSSLLYITDECFAFSIWSIPDFVSDKEDFVGLEEVVLPYSVDSSWIGLWAFYGWPNLNHAYPVNGIFLDCYREAFPDWCEIGCKGPLKLQIYNGIVVGWMALADEEEEDSDLKSGVLYVPDGVTEIAESALSGIKFRSVVLPDSCVAMSEGAFGEKSAVRELIVGTGRIMEVKSLAQSAGLDTTSVDVREKAGDGVEFVVDADGVLTGYRGEIAEGSALIIPDGVRQISYNAFAGAKMASVTIPDSCEMIHSYAFSGAMGIRRVFIGKNVWDVSGVAFDGCIALEDMVISPDNVNFTTYSNGLYSADRRILYCLFPSCKELEIPDELDEISADASAGMSGLECISISGKNENFRVVDSVLVDMRTMTVVCAPRVADELIIPDGCIAIGEYACRGGLYGNVTFPSTLRRIGYGAFEDCQSLKTAALPDGLETIGDSAFWGCVELSGLSVPESVRCIGAAAFEDTKWMNDRLWDESEEMDLFPGLICCDGWVLGRCYEDEDAVEALSLPEGIVGIAGSALSGMSFSSVSLPESLKYIGAYAMGYNSDLTCLIIPTNVMTIGEGALSSCDNLESVVFKADSRRIAMGWYVFDGTPFGEDFFYLVVEDSAVLGYCGGAFPENLVIPDGVETIAEYAFEGCCDLASIAFPESLRSIGNGAFYCCENLETVALNDGLEGIGEEAFADVYALTEIEIPASVRRIGAWAFGDDSSLQRIVCMGDAPSVNECPFEGISPDARLYVMKGSRGWRGSGGSGLPYRWPEEEQDGDSSVRISYFQTATPVIVVRADEDEQIRTVSLYCADVGASVHYTTDGSMPTAQSAVYLEPIAISKTTTIRAVAVADALPDSEISERTVDFERPIPWYDLIENDDWKPWRVVRDQMSGRDSLFSPVLNDCECSAVEYAVENAAAIAFDWKSSGEDGYDEGRFYVDDEEVAVISGESEWQRVIYRLDETGAHTFRWEYSKDDSFSIGADAIWLSNVIIGSSAISVLVEGEDVSDMELSEIIKDAASSREKVTVRGDVVEDLQLSPRSEIEIEGQVLGRITVVAEAEDGSGTYDITGYMRGISNEPHDGIVTLKPDIDPSKVSVELATEDPVVMAATDEGVVVDMSITHTVPGLYYVLETANVLDEKDFGPDVVVQAEDESGVVLSATPTQASSHFYRVNVRATDPFR